MKNHVSQKELAKQLTTNVQKIIGWEKAGKIQGVRKQVIGQRGKTYRCYYHIKEIQKIIHERGVDPITAWGGVTDLKKRNMHGDCIYYDTVNQGYIVGSRFFPLHGDYDVLKEVTSDMFNGNTDYHLAGTTIIRAFQESTGINFSSLSPHTKAEIIYTYWVYFIGSSITIRDEYMLKTGMSSDYDKLIAFYARHDLLTCATCTKTPYDQKRQVEEKTTSYEVQKIRKGSNRQYKPLPIPTIKYNERHVSYADTKKQIEENKARADRLISHAKTGLIKLNKSIRGCTLPGVGRMDSVLPSRREEMGLGWWYYYPHTARSLGIHNYHENYIKSNTYTHINQKEYERDVADGNIHEFE